MSTVADFEFEALARRVAVLETQGEVLTEGVADLEERLRSEDAKAEMRASKRLEKLMAQLGVNSYGEARTAINELRQHQTTENAKRLKDRAEFLAHKLEDAQAVNEKQDIDNAFLRADLERMQAEIKRLEARQLPDGAEWPVDADGVRIEVGDVLREDDSHKEFIVDSIGFHPHVTDKSGGFYFSRFNKWHHVQPEPAEPQDPWEKLEEDASLLGCAYWDSRDKQCEECDHGGEMYCGIPLDIVRRAKALAGVE